MKHLSPRTKLASLLLATCLALAPVAFAVSPPDDGYPPPDGGYPNGNTAEGKEALFSITRGNQNIPKYNTAIGFQALANLTDAYFNTAVGAAALRNNREGIINTAIGCAAMSNNDAGSNNAALGANALLSNTGGSANTAIGTGAMYSNTTGISNTATGFEALYINTEGQYNTATGSGALFLNRAGDFNTASGEDALGSNTKGANNTAMGARALVGNTTGNFNIAVGYNAGQFLRDGINNIDIGNHGVASDSNTIRIGTQGTQTATYVAGISGATVAGGVGVVIDTAGHLGTVTSSARYKEAIKPMGDSSDTILNLKPVTFRYKKELDSQAVPQFGLVAEDVEKVDPDLVAHDADGKPYTIRYEAVNAMLLNEFLKEHRKVEEQSSHMTKQDGKMQTLEATIAKQQVEIRALMEAMKAQATQIQKVSAPRGASKPPRLVADSQ